jgi:hypothetical protein
MEKAQALSPLGWTFMIVSVTFVAVLMFWCFKKVLSLPPEEKSTVKDIHSA